MNQDQKWELLKIKTSIFLTITGLQSPLILAIFVDNSYMKILGSFWAFLNIIAWSAISFDTYRESERERIYYEMKRSLQIKKDIQVFQKDDGDFEESDD